MLPSAVGAHSCLVTPLFAKFCAQEDPGVAWGCGEVGFLNNCYFNKHLVEKNPSVVFENNSLATSG